MRSPLSLLAALVVAGVFVAGGYWLYQLVASSPQVSLALTNSTHSALTVDMRKDTELVRFQILPGHTETRSFVPGVYRVVGKISDPNTDLFSTEWTFQSGGRYNATFSRDGQGNTEAILEVARRGAAPPEQKEN